MMGGAESTAADPVTAESTDAESDTAVVAAMRSHAVPALGLDEDSSFKGTIGFITKITPATPMDCQVPSAPGFPISQDVRYVVETEYDPKSKQWMLKWIDERVIGAYNYMVIGSFGEPILPQYV